MDTAAEAGIMNTENVRAPQTGDAALAAGMAVLMLGSAMAIGAARRKYK